MKNKETMVKLRLREFCRERSVSLSQLAAWTGIARVSLSRYAHGVQDITLGQLFKILSVTGSSLQELVDDREDLTSPEWNKAIQKASRWARRQKDKSWVPRVTFMTSWRHGVSHVQTGQKNRPS